MCVCVCVCVYVYECVNIGVDESMHVCNRMHIFMGR